MGESTYVEIQGVGPVDVFRRAVRKLQAQDFDFPDLQATYLSAGRWEWAAAGWWYKSRPEDRGVVARALSREKLYGRLSVEALPIGVQCWASQPDGTLTYTGVTPRPRWTGFQPTRR